MTPAYAVKLGLTIWNTSIGTQKIDGLLLKINDMVLTRYLLQNSRERIWLFEETCLLADTSIKVVLEMTFLAVSNANFKFGAEKRI